MRDRIERLLQAEQALQILLVVLADREGTVDGLAQRPVLLAHALEAGEGVEADDLAVPVERLEDAAQRRQQRQRLAPAHAELHHHAVGVQDLLVDLVEEQDARQRLGGQKQAEIGQEFVVGQRRALEQLDELVLQFLFALAREHDRVVLLRLDVGHVLVGCPVSVAVSRMYPRIVCSSSAFSRPNGHRMRDFGCSPWAGRERSSRPRKPALADIGRPERVDVTVQRLPGRAGERRVHAPPALRVSTGPMS